VGISGMVHTRDESLQDVLGDIQTYRMTLASAYVLHYLSAIWSQLQMSEMEVSADLVCC